MGRRIETQTNEKLDVNFKFIWNRIQEFKRELLVVSAIAMLGAATTLVLPWLAGQLLGGLFDTGSTDQIEIAGWLVLALAASAALDTVAGIVSAKTSGRILGRLRTSVYQHVQLLPVEFHDRNRRGDLLAMMTYEVGELSQFLAATVTSIPAMVLTATGAMVLLLVIDPAIGFIVPILLLAFYALVKLLGRRLRSLAEEVQKTEAEVMWVADSDLEMVNAIKAFAVEENHQNHYGSVVERARKLTYREDRIAAFIGPIIGLVAATAAVTIIVYGGLPVADDRQSPGDLFAFLLYAALLTRPVSGLADFYGHLQIARGTVARIEAVLKVPEEEGYQATHVVERANGEIEFDNVTFGYDGRDRILDAASFRISPGEIVALTGDNGAGKSTIVRLLLRFYAPETGKILLDGVDTGEAQVQSLRAQFGYVPQRALLFNGTIAENIKFAADDTPDAALENAAKLAQAWDFIQDLPEGMDTPIGDSGICLSGGQRQRIALARALLRDPPVLIFDEATSMFDQEGEAALIEACREALEGRTVILISHRPESLALATRVLHVAHGSITEVAKPSASKGRRAR